MNPFEILARKEPLTLEEWWKLTEARYASIAPHLKEMNLGSLGELKAIQDYFGTHEIARDRPSVNSDGVIDLNTRGIFPPDDSPANISAKTEDRRDDRGQVISTIERIWGLTESGQWLTIDVQISRTRERHRREHRIEDMAKAVNVSIEKCTMREAAELSGRSPEYFWHILGNSVKKVLEQRKMLYDEILELDQQISIHEYLVEVISSIFPEQSTSPNES